jgi:hypothetical protein
MIIMETDRIVRSDVEIMTQESDVGGTVVEEGGREMETFEEPSTFGTRHGALSEGMVTTPEGRGQLGRHLGRDRRMRAGWPRWGGPVVDLLRGGCA